MNVLKEAKALLGNIKDLEYVNWCIPNDPNKEGEICVVPREEYLPLLLSRKKEEADFVYASVRLVRQLVQELEKFTKG